MNATRGSKASYIYLVFVMAVWFGEAKYLLLLVASMSYPECSRPIFLS